MADEIRHTYTFITDTNVVMLRSHYEQLVKERDEAQHRARRACQVLIAEVGAHGPADVDSVAERSAAEIQNLRDEIEGLRAEVEMLRERLEVERTPNGAGKWNAERVLREKAERERDEERKAYMDLMDERNQIHAERDYERMQLSRCQRELDFLKAKRNELGGA